MSCDVPWARPKPVPDEKIRARHKRLRDFRSSSRPAPKEPYGSCPLLYIQEAYSNSRCHVRRPVMPLACDRAWAIQVWIAFIRAADTDVCAVATEPAASNATIRTGAAKIETD